MTARGTWLATGRNTFGVYFRLDVFPSREFFYASKIAYKFIIGELA